MAAFSQERTVVESTSMVQSVFLNSSQNNRAILATLELLDHLRAGVFETVWLIPFASRVGQGFVTPTVDSCRYVKISTGKSTENVPNKSSTAVPDVSGLCWSSQRTSRVTAFQDLRQVDCWKASETFVTEPVFLC